MMTIVDALTRNCIIMDKIKNCLCVKTISKTNKQSDIGFTDQNIINKTSEMQNHGVPELQNHKMMLAVWYKFLVTQTQIFSDWEKTQTKLLFNADEMLINSKQQILSAFYLASQTGKTDIRGMHSFNKTTQQLTAINIHVMNKRTRPRLVILHTNFLR